MFMYLPEDITDHVVHLKPVVSVFAEVHEMTIHHLTAY